MVGNFALVSAGIVTNLIVADPATWESPGQLVPVTSGVFVGDSWDGQHFAASPERLARTAAENAEQADRTNRRTAAQAAMANWDSLTNTQKDARMRTAFPVLIRMLLEDR